MKLSLKNYTTAIKKVLFGYYFNVFATGVMKTSLKLPKDCSIQTLSAVPNLGWVFLIPKCAAYVLLWCMFGDMLADLGEIRMACDAPLDG